MRTQGLPPGIAKNLDRLPDKNPHKQRALAEAERSEQTDQNNPNQNVTPKPGAESAIDPAQLSTQDILQLLMTFLQSVIMQKPNEEEQSSTDLPADGSSSTTSPDEPKQEVQTLNVLG